MAKSKEIEAITAVQPVQAAGTAEPAKQADPRDEEIARLKAELEAERSKKAEPAAIAGTVSPSGRFLVKVQDAPSWVVEAVDSANAFQEYKRAVGMISTPHPWSAEAVGDEVPLGRYLG